MTALAPSRGSVHRRPRPRRLRISRGVVGALGVAAATVAALLALAFMTQEERYVAAPGFACSLLMLYLVARLWARDRVVPLFDIGFLCTLATFAYSVYPLLNYWHNGLEFSYADLSDTRLSSYAPTPLEIGSFHLRHVLYLLCLVVSYLALRGRGRVEAAAVEPPPITVQYVILISFAALVLYFAALSVATGIQFHTSYATDDVERNLEALSSAPRWLLQISGKLAGLMFVMKLALLYIVISRIRQRRWWIAVLAAWVILEVGNTFITKGARGGMVLLLLATVLLYHRLVRRFSFKMLAIVGGGVFALFMFLGLYRSFTDLATLQAEMRQTEAGLLGGNNEFQALLGTAYDVAQRKAAGVTLPGYLYINDIVDVLPPQQLLPFQKVTASEWYLRELGVSGTGQGYMWGVITQSIVGLDWIELAIRGLVLGALLAWLHRWYRRRQNGFVETFVYVYLCIHIFYTFRNTTFSILANIVWELIPFFVIVAGSVILLSRRQHTAAAAADGVSAAGSGRRRSS